MHKDIFSNYKFIAVILIGLVTFLLLTESVFTQTNAEFRTSAAMAPGAPAGSYSLNNIETVNLYNGNLNFNLPLVSIGERGSAGYTMPLPIEHKWQVNRDDSTPGYTFFTPVYEWWTGDKPGYSPGIVRVRQIMEDCHEFAQPIQTNSNLTFTASDGTEIELKDTIAYAEPQTSNCSSTNGASRGTTFVSKDGSHMTFISDTVIYDRINTSSLFLYPSGKLMFKDGTIYRIDNGAVSWIRDRNGNRLMFTYNTQLPRSMTVTDSLNRQVVVEYDINDGAPYGLCDKITFKGTGGATKIIRISKGELSAALKSGETLKTLAQLFPNVGSGTNNAGNSTTAVNPHNIISSVWLPDGRRYQFFYNSYADLTKVILPTGAVIEYDWWGSDEHNAIYRRVSERRSYPDGTTLESKTIYDTPSYYNPGPVVVRQKSANDTQISVQKHYFYGNAWYESIPPPPFSVPPAWNAGREFKTENYSSDGITLLGETTQNWYQDTPTWGSQSSPLNNPRITETTLKLADTNQVSKQTFSYDQFNNQTDVYEYDYGTAAPGAFKRRTHTDYVTDTNYTSHTGAHLRSLPLQTWVSSDNNGATKASLTQYEYDNYSGDDNNAALFPRSNVVGHDTTNYGTNNTKRGNVTKVTYGNAQNQTEAVSAYTNYDILGNVVKTIDAKGNSSTIDYTDRFGSPDNEAQSNTPPTQLNGQNTFAFPTSATNAVGWITGYSQVDYFTGTVVNTEDINGVISKMLYNDVLDRPTQSVTAIGTSFERQSNVIYDDINRRIETKGDLNALNDNLLKSESFYDGLGRTIEARKYEQDGGYVATKAIPFVVIQDTETNIWRAAVKQSNPYRPLANEQPVWTTSLRDELGRAIKTITPDGAMAKTVYSGNIVTVTDQAGKQSRSITNALGQLTRVDEPDKTTGSLGSVSSPVQPTNYKYNTIGKMIEVSQGVQQRHFLYDSLGRLLRVRQPEQQVNAALNLANPESANTQWTVGLSYDNNGNVLTTTDAKNVTTTNIYDALNRVTKRSYNDTVTPEVNFTYDDSNVPFSKGKLTKVGSTISETRYTVYDTMGRLTASEQRTPFGAETVVQAVPRTSEYKYNLAGIMTEQTYPSGRVTKNILESDGDLATISSRVSNGDFKTYASNFAYTASGVIKHLQIGSGLWESAIMNSRDQVMELNLGNSPTDGSLWKLNYDYGEFDANGNVDAAKNAGNIARQTISFNGLTQFVQTYKYDSLDRIKEAKEMSGTNQTWIQTFDYDRYGNRTTFSQNVLGQQMAINNQTLPTVDQNTNRFFTTQGYIYDANGNLTNDFAGRQFTFDGDNKQTLVKDASNNPVGQYFYDGNGKRVKKVTNTETVIFVYDGAGKLVAEYSTATPTQNPTVNYTATDPLGSPRVITNKQGQIVSRRDFMPFGEELSPDSTYRTANLKYGANDNIRQKFTGYQRDEETDLDFAEARYYNNNHGRFTAVDPLLASGKSANPQTFNRYAYTMNRPLILTDPTGLQAGSEPNYGRRNFDGYYYYPTLKEIRFAVNNPRAAIRIGTAYDRDSLSAYALRFSRNLVTGLSNNLTGRNGQPVGYMGTQVNAVRHVVWQALITKELGSTVATQAGNAHEQNPRTDLSQRTFTGSAYNIDNADQTVDLLNNQIGRQIGENNPDATNNELAVKAIEYFRDTGFFTATINQDGSVGISRTRISSEEAKKAIANIGQVNEYGRTPAEQRADDERTKEVPFKPIWE